MIDGFWLYTVDPTAEEPIMLIDGHIGFDEAEGFGVMGDLFQKELLQLDGLGKSRIQVWINSPGGVVADGYSIYNAILKSNTKVDTYCTGMAASIAGVVFQAGRTRYMADYSWLMYHNPFGGDDPEALITIADSLAKMISERSGKSVDEIKAIMKKTTYIMADEALAGGLCDKVEASADQNKKRAAASTSNAKAFLKVASEITNKLLPQTSNQIDMKKVANKLNLNIEASEDAIVSEIEKVQNKVGEHETTIAAHLQTIKNKDGDIAKKEEECKSLKDELKKAQDELAAMKEKAKNEAEAAKTKAEAEEASKAKNMIDGYVTEGRIKNEEKVKNEWIDNCKVLGIDKVKNMIESLPLNKVANKIAIGTTGDTAKVGSVVNRVMATKLSKLQGNSNL